MTRGRKPEWADAPLAEWLRVQLERGEKDKKWLGEQLAGRRGISAAAASRAVTRWTFKGTPPTAATLSRDYATALGEIFGEEPPGVDHGSPGRPVDVQAIREAVRDVLVSDQFPRLEALATQIGRLEEAVGALLEEQSRRGRRAR